MLVHTAKRPGLPIDTVSAVSTRRIRTPAVPDTPATVSGQAVMDTKLQVGQGRPAGDPARQGPDQLEGTADGMAAGRHSLLLHGGLKERPSVIWGDSSP